MVRAVKLETSSSGTYYNPSQGAFLSPIGSSTGSYGTNNASVETSTSGTTGTSTSTTPVSTGSSGSTTPTPASTGTVVYVDDALPAGASLVGGTGGDSWSWISAGPAPFAGSVAHQSALAQGLHEHSFSWATATLPVNTGETLFSYVYLDPANPPAEIMVQWFDGSWDHRAYWGANYINHGTDGTAGRRYIGALPPAGQWVRLQVPANLVDLEGKIVNGMAFSQYNGRAVWDYSGKSAGLVTAPPSTATNSAPVEITSTNTSNQAFSITNNVVWFDDALPLTTQYGGEGGDSWAWVSSDPAPLSGSVSHQSAIAAGFHQHYFDWATQTLTVNPGDSLFTYVYVDPANPPQELMLHWTDGSWDHRAYWGANLINYGVNGTVNRQYMGPMPAAGVWVRLEVPASMVALEGKTIHGMSFSQYDGRATWDYAGKAFVTTNSVGNSGSGSSGSGSGISTPTNSTPAVTNSSPVITNGMIYVDDTLPAGAIPSGEGGDSWNWTSMNPAPMAGKVSHSSASAASLHQHFFSGATQTMPVNVGDLLFTYVYLDPANPPSQIMLQWNSGSWEHRAYWGANQISYGTDGTASRRYIGPLPAVGKWVRLEVPAAAVALEDTKVSGMAFSLYGGRASWDYSGTGQLVPSDTSGSTPTATNSVGVTSWVDDSLPAGAVQGADGGDTWTWTTIDPTPASGTVAHPSVLANGLHQHYFYSATSTLPVSAGDILFANVYLDPANPPSELMLQWNNGNWEHRAYWGANSIDYGTQGTASRSYMGPLPAVGQWTLLQVPASQVGLEGHILSGMSFSVYNGRAVWDNAGKSTALQTTTPGNGSATNSIPSGTNSVPSGTNSVPPGTNSVPSVTNSVPPGTNTLPKVSLIDYTTLELPQVGDTTLHVLTPTVLELKLINTKTADASSVNEWNFVDANSQFPSPSPSLLAVTVNGQTVPVLGVGFKRRPLYAPLATYDLRIENSMYLQLSAPVSDNAVIEVKNPDASLWNASRQFIASVDPLRYSPAIHVNQEGYMPNYVKKGRIGYYAGSMGELNITASSGFKLVRIDTGETVFQGSLTQDPDIGYTYSPTPYQKVYEADFTAFNTPGEYRLVVPGMGGSLPFLINEGVAMGFTRAYALGLYHQRCGTNTAMPYTRFTHDQCHAAPAEVPVTADLFPFTWTTVANYANSINGNNPPQKAPALTSPSAQLFPFIRQGPVDTTGGHHDAGDYSKYTINSASLIHYLTFAADALSGVVALDNLGIPESGDGISDVLQEAKWEADYLLKLQDDDGGFYFLVYPKNREYENNVTPDKGDSQVVWPKTTSATAASVAALAQCASSPKFKQFFPKEAATYLEKAKLGWQFLMNAITKYGKDAMYQKITHYGDDYTDCDELAWAACEMFLATGDAVAHQLLKQWFDPSDPSTWRWGWWRMSQAWGHAIRSYAFAARSGRVPASQLDAAYMSKCEAQIVAAADDTLKWAQQSAYGSSFPEATKQVKAAGWYFSTDQAFDIAVAQQISPKAAYVNAIVSNMDYEGGCNPVNVTYVTGLGWKRQRDVVSQWAVNDKQTLPPSGEPVGNITGNFGYLWYYGGLLNSLCFPSDAAATAPYPFYDRWGDSWNVNAEFVVLNSARSLGTLAWLAAQTALKSQPWKAQAGARIVVPSGTAPVGQPVTLSLEGPTGVDLSQARITWEARDQEPSFGSTYTFSPKNNGTQWVEAEAQLPDGRRVFATSTLSANAADVVWVGDSLPAGAVAGTDGGDAWNWVTANPSPQSGTKAHKSTVIAGSHQHYFNNATGTLQIGTGDILYTWVYLDPANMPTEIMLHWNDGSWEHRAYWGSNQLSYGQNGTASRRYMGVLPAAGQWVQLQVPASQVGLEGSTLKGMSFSLYDGSATFDTTGRKATM